jgi:thiol-disulfide isomerase/thioredoxin
MLSFGFALLFSLAGKAQNDATASAPYLKNPSLPAFRILLPDSTHWFTQADLRKDKAVMFMVFNPECEHCQKEAETLQKYHKDFLASIEIVMTTYQDMQKMREFIRHYDLGSIRNVHVGRDVNYFFGTFFNMHYLPFLAFYDKHGKLAKVFEGGAQADKLREIVEGL